MKVQWRFVWMLGAVLACHAASSGAATRAAGAREAAKFLERARSEAALGLGTELGLVVFDTPPVPQDRPAHEPAGSKARSIEFYVTGGGRGASQSFAKSSCLFCAEFKSEAKRSAEAWAVWSVEGQCQARKAFLKERPRIEELTCERIDGWMSYYSCRAQVSATCIVPVH